MAETLENNVTESEFRHVSAHQLLGQGIESLRHLHSCLQQNEDLVIMITQLRDTMQIVQSRLDSKMASMAQYRVIAPYVSWFTRHPSASYISLSNRDPILLLFLFNMYAVVVLLALAMPAVDTPFFASVRLRGMTEILKVLSVETVVACTTCNACHDLSSLMVFPIQVMDTYKMLRQLRSSSQLVTLPVAP